MLCVSSLHGKKRKSMQKDLLKIDNIKETVIKNIHFTYRILPNSTEKFRVVKSIYLLRSATSNGGVGGWVSGAAHVMGAVILNVFQPGIFVWFEKTQSPLVKVLPVLGWRPMKLLATLGHFLRCVLCFFSTIVTVAYRETRASKGYNPTNRERLLYVTTNDQTVHQRQPLRVIVVELTVTEGRASIQPRYHTFRSQKGDHCPPFLLGANRQLSHQIEQSFTPQQLREKTSDTLCRSVADYPPFSAGY
ncbi:uncharacterized protein TNCV_1518941 [Trichonephila clavipes]|nr:uncharacterized protein TNCV_1518941 [Trichonephila clavipes]